MSLPAVALRRPVTTVTATLALVLLGAVSLGRLPVSLLPDVTLPVLTIRTSYPGAAAPEVSRFIAEPIEEAIAATPGLVELRSLSPQRAGHDHAHPAVPCDLYLPHVLCTLAVSPPPAGMIPEL